MTQRIQDEAKNDFYREYERIIKDTPREARREASKKVSEILRHAQIGLVKSDGDAVNSCIDAVFDAYFRDGSAGIARALRMLEE